MIKVPLVDSTFAHSHSMSLAGENKSEHPVLMRWDRATTGGIVRVWTDLRLEEVVGDPAPKKIALLIEPRGLTSTHYDLAWELRTHFDTILTYDKKLVKEGEPFKFYPFGGSWIKDWGMFEKEYSVSILVSAKRFTVGQKLRHAIAENFTDRVTLFGEPYTPRIKSKTLALTKFRYSIIIESDRRDWYFSEKLIDCMSQGTVPIYWGCPEIGRFFDPSGIITFEGLDDLEEILGRVCPTDYKNRTEPIAWNMNAADEYRCSEDWIVRNYPELFGS